jgi:hypothetical protein
MVIRVGNEGQIDGLRQQFHRIGFAHNADNVLDVFLLAGSLNVLDKFRSNLHGKYFAFRSDIPCKKAGEKTCARTNVCDHHSRLDRAGSDYLLAFNRNLPTFLLESRDELLDIGILERFVNSGADAFFFLPNERNERRTPRGEPAGSVAKERLVTFMVLTIS